MPKQKPPIIESFLHHLDRLSPVENVFESLRPFFRSMASFYGFEKISSSVLEDARLFTSVVKAGMLNERPPVIFKPSIGVETMARVSGVLSVLRAYRAHKMSDLPQPVKLFFEGESFSAVGKQEHPIQRRDELGLVIIGEEGPIAEAQMVQVIWKTLLNMGIAPERIILVINAIGCSQCYAHFRSSLTSFLRNRMAGLCKNCKRNAKITPTRILVCEEEKCSMISSHAPQILDFLCERCKKHLRGFLEYLDELGIPYYLDSRRFRNGMWADTCLFEFTLAPRPRLQESSPETVATEVKEGEGSISQDIGSDVAAVPVSATIAMPTKRGAVVAEGGRAGKVAELMGNKGLEVAAGTLFLDTILNTASVALREEQKPDVFLVQLGELARRRSLRVLEMLRLAGITVRESLGRDAIKSQLNLAEKFGSPMGLILGQKEVIDQTIIVREMDSGIQETVLQEKMIDFLKRRLKK